MKKIFTFICALVLSVNISAQTPLTEALDFQATAHHGEEIVEDIVVYTITGVIVCQQSTVNSQQTLTIDLSDLKSGIYFVKINTEKGNIVKRIIKN